MKKQVRAIYSGRVQGIGFRFTAEDLAREKKVCGWVKNLRDGRVEIVAEAEEEALKDYLAQIYETFSRYVKDVEINWSAATDEFSDFRVEF